jgi:hypothetical protein
MACDEAADAAWQEARITKTKELILAYEEAILALSTGAQSYTLNTGQTQQTVMKGNLASLRDTLKWLETRLANLQADACGGGATHVTPGF